MADFAAANQEKANEAEEAAMKEDEFDPYAILEVALDANFAQIKKAYRAAVLKWHPDKYSGAELDHATSMFNKIKLANNVLSDANKRGQLDSGISTAEVSDAR